MRSAEIETILRNVDLRVGRIEQFLPSVATKEELAAAVAKLATKEELAAAVAPLATREEMHAAIAAAVAPLPTREEMRAAIAAAVAPLATKEDLAEVRRHAVILTEDVRGDIRLLAEHVAGLVEQRYRDR
jgi:hypothetical protein